MKNQPKDSKLTLKEAALNVAYAMMSKGVYQYPLEQWQIDLMSKEAVTTAKRLIEQIEKDIK